MSEKLIPTLPCRPGRPKKRNPKGSLFKQKTVLLDDDLTAALDRQAEAEGMDSRSAILRKACREYLRRAAKRASREDGEK